MKKIFISTLFMFFIFVIPAVTLYSGMSTTQTGHNAFNYFDKIVMTKQSGKINPYAKCPFRYVAAGSYVPASASVNKALIHNY